MTDDGCRVAPADVSRRSRFCARPNRIVDEVRGINRVVYDVGGKPAATIERE